MDADLRRELDRCINDVRAVANLLTEAASQMDGAVQGLGDLKIAEEMRHYSSKYADVAKRLNRVR